jgi:outer membrane immunogenic protein
LKHHFLLAISVLALTAVSQPLFAAEVETPAPAPAAERAPARQRPAQPARERAPAQRQAAQQSPTSSFTGSQAGGFGGGNTGGGGFADPAYCGGLIGSFSNTCGNTFQNISRSTGFIGGAEYGYMFPIGGYWVAGFAADLSGSTLKASNTQTTTKFVGTVPIYETYSSSQRQAASSTLRVKIGFVPWMNTLVFATAGGAAGTVEGNFSYTGTDPTTGGTAFGTGNYNLLRFGYVVGGGVTVAYPVLGNTAANVTVEYLYQNLGTVDQAYLVVATGGAASFALTSMKTENSTVRLKLSYGL